MAAGRKSKAADRRALFVEAFVTNGENAAEAYRAAGYAEKGANANAARLIANDSVRIAIDIRRAQVIAKIEKNTEITKERIFAEMWDNAMKAKAAEPVRDREGKPTGEFTAQFSASTRALELCGKEMRMFVDRTEVGDPGAFDRLEDDELERAERECAAAISVARATAAADPKTADQRGENST